MSSLGCYPDQATPSSFASLNTICRSFLWADRPARLGWNRLTLPKQKGGIGLPDPSLYYTACQLTRIVDWHVHWSSKDWVSLKDAILGIRVAHLPWIEPHSTPNACKSHPLIGPTLTTFRVTCRSFDTTPSPGPMTPLTQNPYFPTGIQVLAGPTPSGDRTVRAHLFFYNDTLLSHSALESSRMSVYHALNTSKFDTFLIVHRPFWFGTETSHPFEHLCNQPDPQKHLISSLYSLLVSKVKPNTDIHRSWETDLYIALSNDWESVWEHTHKGSVNVSAQENRFKIYSSWYRTPDKLHKIFPSVPSMCWRCMSNSGTLLHVWWDCPVLQPFWKEIHSLISQITTYTPDFTPAQYLLHHTSLPKSTYCKSLTLHLINAAQKGDLNASSHVVSMWIPNAYQFTGMTPFFPPWLNGSPG